MGSIPGQFFLVLGFLLSIACVSHSMNDASETSPNYTSLIWNVTYHSSSIKENISSFTSGYYDFAKGFVNFLMPEALPHGVLKLQENENTISLFLSLVWFYRRIVLFVFILTIKITFLIYGIVKTIYSLKSRRKTHYYAPKSTSWKNGIVKKYGKWMQLGWIHSLLTLMVFMTALAHHSNEDIDQGTKMVSLSLDNSFMDIETYIDTTTEQLETLLTKNLEEYLEFFVGNSERTVEEILIDLENSLVDIDLFENVVGIEHSFKSVEPILSEIKRLSEQIINITDQIEHDLNNLGRHIPCVTEKCSDIIKGGKELVNGTIKDLGKGIVMAGNLTSDITGGIIGSFEDPGNLTAGIGGKAIEGLGKLNNSTANVVGNVFDDLGGSEKVLSNVTSSIGGEVIEGGKMIENLTENIGTNVITDLGKTKEALTDLTSSITGGNLDSNIGNGVNKLKNFTENIEENIFGGIGGMIGGHSTSDVEQKGKSISTFGDLFNFGKNEEKDVTSKPKSDTGLGGTRNSFIDFRNGGTEEVTETNKVSNPKRNNIVDNIENKIGDVSKKFTSVFGFRRKRELEMDLDSLLGEFRKISSTINDLVHFMDVDMKNMKNVSIILTPVVKKIGVIIRRVLNEVKEEIKLGAKPLETILQVVKKTVDNIKHQLLAYMKVIFDWFQFLIDVLEPFRYSISYFVTYFLLLSFFVLIIGMTSRIVKEHKTTEYIIKGGVISLYAAALIMAFVSLVYLGAGVASQKFLCETFQDSKDNGVLELIDEMNPAKLGPYVNVSLRRIIDNCQKDESLYEVADLQKLFNLEEIENKYLNVKDIEKKLQEVLIFPLNFSKILPSENFEKAEETLFGAFKNVMDSPVISTIETLKNEIGSLPGIGDILKTFTDKIMSLEENFNALKSVNKGNNDSFFEDLENSVLRLEKELSKIENNVVGTIQNITSKLQKRVIESLTMYVEDRLIFSIKHSLGRCEPLSIALNTSVEAICRNITTPANGHWFCWYICIIITIIILIYSIISENVSRYASRKQSILSKVYHVDETEMDTIASENEGINKDLDESSKKTEAT